MPKKSTAARSGAQRNKARPQKNFELVRQATEETGDETSTRDEIKAASVSTAELAQPEVIREETIVEKPVKSSAATRLAAKRQAPQKATRAATLVTAEHYAYVRRDLVTIAIISVLLCGTIIALYFILGNTTF